MFAPTSPPKLHNVRDVKRELVNWREYYNAEVATAESSIGRVSEPGRAWLAAVDEHRVACSIADAPDDALAVIFSHLCYRDLVLGVGCVSRRMHAMSKHPLLWRTFHLAHLAKTSQLPVASRFCRVDRLFSRVEIENFWLRQLVEGRISPVELELQTCSVSRRSMTQILSTTKSIRSLDLSYCPNVDDELLEVVRESPSCTAAAESSVLGQSVFHGEASMRALRLSFCSGYSPAALVAIAMKAPWLQRVDVSGCDQLTAADFNSLLSTAVTLRGLTCNATNIAEASFADLPPLALKQFHATSTKIDDACLVLLGAACSKLEDVAISSCSAVTNNGVLAMLNELRSAAGGATAMVSFVADGCMNLSDAAMVPLITASPNLRRISLDRSKVSTGTLERALQCEKIERISVASCLHLMRDMPRQPQLRRNLSMRRSLLDKGSKQLV